MDIVIITGMSGSGKTVALNVLEDTGYFCIDNLPPRLLSQLVDTLSESQTTRLAVAIDSRSATSLNSVPDDIDRLREVGHDVKVLFLTANNASLIARFSETRRSHPLVATEIKKENKPRNLTEAIMAERDILGSIEKCSHLIDTSHMSANKLRQWIKEFVEIKSVPLSLYFESFAFKLGVPQDAALMFDVRMLPNPHYDLFLRPMSGKDASVIAFLEEQAMVVQMFDDIRAFIEKWLPAFKQDHRSYLTIAIGCTGGKHRSVYMTEKLAQYFQNKETVMVRHRDLVLDSAQ